MARSVAAEQAAGLLGAVRVLVQQLACGLAVCECMQVWVHVLLHKVKCLLGLITVACVEHVHPR